MRNAKVVPVEGMRFTDDEGGRGAVTAVDREQEKVTFSVQDDFGRHVTLTWPFDRWRAYANIPTY